MDPYYEQRLRDEVSYLHSLWHQGPPRNPNLHRNPTPNPSTSRHLQLSNPTQFKKEKTRIRRKRVKKGKKRPPESDPPLVSDVEWTGNKPAEGPTQKPPSAPATVEQAQFPATELCDLTQLKKEKTRARRRGKRGKKRPPESDPPPVSDVEWPGKKPAETPSSSASASGWPTVKPPSARLPSVEEQARFAATQVQQKALKAVQEFFAVSDGREDGGSDDDDDFMDEDEYEEYKFFLNIFTEDGELRGYYEKNCEGGDFCCLVCGGTGKKVGKRFKECVALVHHSLQIAKTKKKRAHRAYAQVICKVLGWDIDRLPTIVLPLGDPLGRSLAKSGVSQGNAEVVMEDLNMLKQNLGSENVNNGELILQEVSNSGQEEELHNSSVPGTSDVVGDNVMLCESSLKVGDANKSIENFDCQVLSVADGKTEGVVNCLEVCDVGREDELHNSSGPGMSNVADNVMLCENSLKVGDANKDMENLDNGVLSMVDGKTEGAVNCLEPCKDTGIGNDMNKQSEGDCSC